MERCLTDLYFLPAPAYFSKIAAYDHLLVEGEEHYVKQSYRNRAHILSANGVQAINVPVVKSAKKQRYRDVKIDYSEPWIRKNHTALQSAYASSPFFDDYYFFIDKILQGKPQFLFDLNLSLLQFCLKVLEMEKIIQPTKTFSFTFKEAKDYREIHTAKRKTPNDWLPYDTMAYKQVFGREFVGNLSILDLIFCEGPLSAKFI